MQVGIFPLRHASIEKGRKHFVRSLISLGNSIEIGKLFFSGMAVAPPRVKKLL